MDQPLGHPSLAEYQASFEELEEEEEEEEKELHLGDHMEEVEEGPDEGEMLVIRRALSGFADQEDTDQREAIFNTRCTIGGKVCSLIIDGGMMHNLTVTHLGAYGQRERGRRGKEIRDFVGIG